jgi:GNAT superfamily N-acetyltransferase
MMVRLARTDEVSLLATLNRESARVLNTPYLAPDAARSVLRYAIAFDPRLVADGTYFVAEEDGAIVGGGGWSRRSPLAGDAPIGPRGHDAPLDPAHDAAPLRAFFVRPGLARRGIGTRLLAACESAARAAGFGALELLATPAGERLYQARGFELIERIEVRHPDGLVFHPARMTRRIRQ